MDERALRVQRHRFQHQPVVLRAHRAGLCTQLHVQVVGRGGHGLVVERDPVRGVERLVPGSRDGEVDRRRLRGSGAAVLDQQVHHQQVAPVIGALQCGLHQSVRPVDDREDLALQVTGRLARFDHHRALQGAAGELFLQGRVARAQAGGVLRAGQARAEQRGHEPAQPAREAVGDRAVRCCHRVWACLGGRTATRYSSRGAPRLPVHPVASARAVSFTSSGPR